MTAYYNEFEPGAAEWLRELIRMGMIADGVVDERSIVDVRPDDIKGFDQCHFFAGVGGWSAALRLAGWPDDRPVWTGSCPCQPFSSAGKRQGTADERHLWPEFFRLIRECRPPVIFGEQVASSEVLGTDLEADFVDAVSRGDCAKANKLAKRLVSSGTVHYHPRWLDGVLADLESIDYAGRANDLPAACVNSPHIRQRLCWLADAERWPAERRGHNLPTAPGGDEAEARQWQRVRAELGAGGDAGGLEHPQGDGRKQRRSEPSGRGVAGGCGDGGMGDAEQQGLEGHAGHGDDGDQPRRDGADAAGSATAASDVGFWSDYDLIPCRDGKARRVERGTFPLAYGIPAGVVPGGDTSVEEVQATTEARVMRLRGYGNAIVPQVAAEFVKAYMEAKR